ncbi:MAG: hypothetical protein KDA52_19695 [Planctomycetaceae bacterium]|nr:hypothetical protein [Planctomycetaceae bacterium]
MEYTQMEIQSAFFAYPSEPSELATTLRKVISRLQDTYNLRNIEGWEQNEIAGQFLSDPIFAKISEKPVLLADITKVNFNVTYEIGYAIGRQRRVMLLKNNALVADSELIKEVGIFDTLGYAEYSNSDELVQLILNAGPAAPLRINTQANRKSPVYYVRPKYTTDSELRIVARIKKARLAFRQFDPEEIGRLSAFDAVENVGTSHGVVVSLVSSQRNNYRVENTRAAFVAGLAAGMGKVLLMLQEGDSPVPLDYRDLVRVHRHLDQINEFIADFASDVTASLQTSEATLITEHAASALASLHLGSPAAENEEDSLGKYFMQTDEFQRMSRGECQIIAGRKGAGKTAMFVQLRNTLRRNRSKIVLDLRPEGYQLRKFRDLITENLASGSRQHVITAFWEYLLLLEVCHKILQKDATTHLSDHTIYQEPVS